MKIDKFTPATGRVMMEDDSIINVADYLINTQDPNSKHITTISTTHHLVHEGKMFTSNHIFEDVPDNGKVYFMHKIGSKPVHAITEYDCEGKTYVKSYAGPVITSNGSLVPYFNRNTLSSEIPTNQNYEGPTISSLGTLRLSQLVLGGLGPQSTGQRGSNSIESIFSPNTFVLLEFHNVSGQSKDIALTMHWYEGGE